MQLPETSLKIIGHVDSTRERPTDDEWDKEDCYIELAAAFSEDALLGLQDFSHVIVLYQMHLVDPQKIEYTARHPRNNPDFPLVGIFAQRGKNRPNPVGISVCKILKVSGKKLFLQGLDAIKGTPVLDLKPWFQEFGPRGQVIQAEWSTSLMEKYWS